MTSTASAKPILWKSLLAADKLLLNRRKISLGDSSTVNFTAETRYDTIYATDSLGNLTDQIASIDTVKDAQAQEVGPLFEVFSPTTAPSALPCWGLLSAATGPALANC
ncbi:MAG: hypothetical protein HC821_02920 [Lewinella sp.]|nr:hypothetical protein [Lewinella sp.]